MSNEVGEQFRLWLHHHEFKNVEKVWRHALVTWNRAVGRTGWPPITLTIPSKRERWGQPWRVFPPQLEKEVDAFFARRLERKP